MRRENHAWFVTWLNWATCKCQELRGAGQSIPGSTRITMQTHVFFNIPGTRNASYDTICRKVDCFHRLRNRQSLRHLLFGSGLRVWVSSRESCDISSKTIGCWLWEVTTPVSYPWKNKPTNSGQLQQLTTLHPRLLIVERSTSYVMIPGMYEKKVALR